MKRIPAIDRLEIPASNVEMLAPEAGNPRKARTYTMIGYTGAEIDRWYGRVIVDMAGMEIAPSLPGFVEHDRSQRACFGTGTIDGGRLVVTGSVLDNEHGAALARDADQGFPFQASIGIQYLRMEELKDGDEKIVNGSVFRGPGYVATKSRVFECSPVSLGADGKTRTQFFAAADQDGPTVEVERFTKEIDMSKEIEAAKAEVRADERKRAASIREILKDHPDVALVAIEAGDSLIEARARLSDKLAKENAELLAKFEKLERAAANPAVGFVGRGREDAHTSKPQAEDFSTLPPEEFAAKEWSRRPEIRKEFSAAGGKDAYAAFIKAEREGRVAIYEPAHGQFGMLAK
jgi:hypothetical protein